MDASEENLGPGRGDLVYSIDRQDGTSVRGVMVSITEPPGGFTLGDEAAENERTEVQYGEVVRITILGYV